MKIRKGFSTATGGQFIIPSLHDLATYMTSSGWHTIDHPNKNITLFSGPPDDDGKPIKLVLPKHLSDSDTSDAISKAIAVIASVENRTPFEIAKIVSNRIKDVFCHRIVGFDAESIPLDMAIEHIRHAKQLVYYSACAEETALPFFESARKVGKEYASRCQFGHTFQGSFGLTIEMPIAPSSHNLLDNSLSKPPFERRVMERIFRGINTASKSAKNSDPDIITNTYEQALNANLCEILSSILQNLGNHEIEFSMLWSREYNLPNDLCDINNITLRYETVGPYLESAAKSLRMTKESEETIVTGKIIELKAFDLDASSQNDGQITIHWEVEKGRFVSIKVNLPRDTYKLACDAHKNNKTVSITGKPEKDGKYFKLTAPKLFTITTEPEQFSLV